MKKDTLRVVIVELIVLALYHVVAFAIPFCRTAAFWLSYGFSLVAVMVAFASIYIAFVKNPDAKSRFYGFPIARIGVVYGGVQMAVSIVVMAVAFWMPWWIALLIYAIGLGAALVGLISAEAVVDEIQQQDVKQKKDTTLMRGLQSKISQIAAQSDDAALKALAEEFRFSDPVSSEAIADAESDLVATVDVLQAAFIDGDTEAVTLLCRKVSALLAERNRLCKLNKN